MRTFSQGLKTKTASDHFRKGLQFKNKPIPKISSVLLVIFIQNSAALAFCNFGITKDKALPTANKKKGKTKSVGVQPCQLACPKGL
jgi:hypothetical protein